VVTTLAGSGAYGYLDATGTAAQFRRPKDAAVDGAGNVYVVDGGNNRVRKITPAGVVTTLAGNGEQGTLDGNGTAAKLNTPISLTVDSAGNIYFAEFYGSRIRKITPAGDVSTLAGGGEDYRDGTGTAARFWNPLGVAVDAWGNVYVADAGNGCIRRISPGGVVTTIAGTGNTNADAGIGTDLRLNSVQSVTLDALGNLYIIAHRSYGTTNIRKITPEIQ
jgi:sugar lactone lactonase YvrE